MIHNGKQIPVQVCVFKRKSANVIETGIGVGTVNGDEVFVIIDKMGVPVPPEDMEDYRPMPALGCLHYTYVEKEPIKKH